MWRALTDPEELLAWDDRRLAPIDPPNGYPREGSPARWRYRLGPVQLVLHDRPRRVAPPRELRSQLYNDELRPTCANCAVSNMGRPDVKASFSARAKFRRQARVAAGVEDPS